MSLALYIVIMLLGPDGMTMIGVRDSMNSGIKKNAYLVMLMIKQLHWL